MTLSQLLKPELVFPKIVCVSKDELITRLVDRIYCTDRGIPLNPQELLKTINMREQIGGTLLPSGLSIPHARLTDYEDFIFAVATPGQPLFDEGHEIRLAAMMITSQSGGPWYLAVLAALTKISRDGAYFSRLCGAEKSEDFLRILKERDLELD